MKRDDLDVIGCFGVIAWMVIMIPLSTVLSGWVLTHLWLWFVVPVFNLPVLPIAPAIGLSLIVSYMTDHNCETDSNKENDSVLTVLISGTLRVLSKPILAYIFGAIVHEFMK